MKLESMTSASTPVTLAHVSWRQLVSHLAQQRLAVGFSPTQCVEAKLLSSYVYFASHQPVYPLLIDLIFTTKHPHLPFVGRSPDENNESSGALFLRIKLPLLRETFSFRSALYPHSTPRSMGFNILVRLLAQLLYRAILESRPNLSRPFAVIAFYPVLKPVLTRRGEDRHDAKTQTGADHSSYRILMLMRPTEAGVVIKLRIVRQTKRRQCARMASRATSAVQPQ